ncbi:hypothetical protein [Butyrivibrio sp. WCD3002]|uniref:hypothetical protein n=1 Tax=Butyrivibrio sp. WCD3002 TaxID=1280676 RepID=UPI000423FB0F|nr:hypothetical protein [Butyrivibrio sp. WCD3002]
MTRNFNRVLAVGMATTMLFGGAMTALAAAGASGTDIGISGAGTEVSAKTDIYQIALPTDDALTSTFKFNVDPEGLIAESGKAFGADVTVNDNEGVLFKNVDGTNVSVSGTSDKLTISNKSYKPVDLKIKVKMTDAGYTSGYSTTSDFSGTDDSTKGLYIGFIATGVAEKAVSATEATLNNAMKSDEAEYELKGTHGTGDNAGTTTYEYALKDATNATGTAFDLQITAAMNRGLAMTTWQTTDATSGVVTAKPMPTISVTFTPTQNKSVIAQAKWNSSWGFDIALKSGTADDGGLGTTAPTAVKWNGRDITGDLTVKNGWATISWAQIIAAYNADAGTEYTASKYDDAIWKGNNVIQFTWGGQTYIADVK